MARLKERIGRLDRFQKGVLLVLAVMAVVFSALYPVTISRVGFEYKDSILVPEEIDGGTVYSGSIEGAEASFTVSPDKTVKFRCGGRYYGPYTLREDPSAIPEDSFISPFSTGVELLCGDEVVFRGAMTVSLDQAGRTDGTWLFNEDGSPAGFGVNFVSNDGLTHDGRGHVVDTFKPSEYAVISLMSGPELTHKGSRRMWLFGMFVCVATACSILFTDELFHFDMSFRIRNADRAEPSGREIARRHVSWTVLPIVALVVFALGLSIT